MIFKWKRWFVLSSVFAIAFSLSIGFNHILSAPFPSNTYVWDIPAWMPKPIVPSDNPMTAEKVELGRYLFYEKRLSVNSEFSCASCHIQALAFTDGKPVSVGATGEKHPRNAMSLANIAYNSVLTWAHPGMKKLEVQALVPMFGERPVEMGLAGKEQDILKMLREDANYRKLFTAAFGRGDNNINLHNLTKAIASFERSLISVNSPYDKYRYGGDKNAISASAKRGETLFNSERLECFHCHGGLNFSDSIKHERLAFEEIAFHNTGLYNLDGKGAYPANNTGIHEITQKSADMGKFKAPTLRNIALTAPYMHDGSIATLEEAIAHYAAGGRTIASGTLAGVGSQNPLKSHFISGFKLTSQEKQDLLDFLKSLTDEEFVKNPAFSNPNRTGN
ncbi:di-heme enzyme [Scytonema sp. UIC 10036]|uniref:methanobactin export MATE transporter MbnM n=1 Tax=Scytonema sp. UIC 10036 TaxID=2304196 RepID=UPI0012DA490D|nr:methanobactin export MATE transporter MbnM [Scytonema sp. UIC 10036]MUG98126.1 di-heme enzyme [Scytonema sp. UIC 10036]